MVADMRSSINNSVWLFTGETSYTIVRNFRICSLEALNSVILNPRNTPERNQKRSKGAKQIKLPTAPKL